MMSKLTSSRILASNMETFIGIKAENIDMWAISCSEFIASQRAPRLWDSTMFRIRVPIVRALLPESTELTRLPNAACPSGESWGGTSSITFEFYGIFTCSLLFRTKKSGFLHLTSSLSSDTGSDDDTYKGSVNVIYITIYLSLKAMTSQVKSSLSASTSPLDSKVRKSTVSLI